MTKIEFISTIRGFSKPIPPYFVWLLSPKTDFESRSNLLIVENTKSKYDNEI